jgi:hypothetical protein
MGHPQEETRGRIRRAVPPAIVDTWHKVRAKHHPAYLDEMCFRFNNRRNQFLFRDTLIKLILSPSLEYKSLTGKV